MRDKKRNLIRRHRTQERQGERERDEVLRTLCQGETSISSSSPSSKDDDGDDDDGEEENTSRRRSTRQKQAHGVFRSAEEEKTR